MSDEEVQLSFLDRAICLESDGDDVFRAALPADWTVAFGGDTLARATAAMARTCNGKELHSLHARFLRPVPGDATITLRVTRTKDGRRMAQRRVEVALDERLLFDATASFVAPGDLATGGHSFGEPSFPLDVPGPETLPTEAARAKENGWDEWVPKDIEWRWPGTPWSAQPSSHWWGWVRTRHPLADDPVVHTAALAFVGDFHSDWAVSRRVGGDFPRDRFISLDHVMWVHDAPRWDGWLLVHSRSGIGRSSRALTHRELYTREGAHLATIAQEALLT